MPKIKAEQNSENQSFLVLADTSLIALINSSLFCNITCDKKSALLCFLILSLSQSSLPLLEVLVTKSHCLQVQLVSTISALSSFLDTLQAVADTASNSKGEINILQKMDRCKR